MTKSEAKIALNNYLKDFLTQNNFLLIKANIWERNAVDCIVKLYFDIRSVKNDFYLSCFIHFSFCAFQKIGDDISTVHLNFPINNIEQSLKIPHEYKFSAENDLLEIVRILINKFKVSILDYIDNNSNYNNFIKKINSEKNEYLTIDTQSKNILIAKDMIVSGDLPNAILFLMQLIENNKNELPKKYRLYESMINDIKEKKIRPTTAST